MTKDLLSVALHQSNELVAQPALVTEQELELIKAFIAAANKNFKFNEKQLYAVLNLTKRAMRKSYKLHKHAKREYTKPE